jgi:CzcA family heavy metal efflux pump
MVDRIIAWSLHNRLFVLVAAVGLLLWGGVRASQMPVDVFPDLTAPTVTVLAEAHGMAPEETERLVTFPIETALNGASGVRRVRSATSVGVATVWVEFEWGTDLYTARQIVTEKLQLVSAALPPEIPPPMLAPISSLMGEILFVGLQSDDTSPRELRTIADWEVRRRLLAVPGVAQVATIGGGVQEFQVRVRPHDLIARGVSLDAVVEAVARANENTSAGFYESGGQEILIYGMGRAETVEDIARAVVEAGERSSIRVQDVADVVVGTAIPRGDAAINGRPGVVVAIQKQPDVNTLALTTQMDRVLNEIASGLPDGVTLERSLLRQATFIETAVSNIQHALRDGAILVILIVGLFLLSVRATLITALAIPLSLTAAVLVLDQLGASLNTMTLGGMAIAVGALVDDAIIDVENVARRLRQRGGGATFTERIAIVFAASKEVRSSIVFATCIIVLVFVPLFFMHGVEGRLLQPLGLAYVVAILASLFVALTVTPVLCVWLLPTSRAVRIGVEPGWVARLRAAYTRLLDRVVDAWPMWVAGSALGVGLALVALAGAGRTFLPAFNEGALTVSAVTLPGTSLSESNALGHRVEAALLQHPEVVSTARRTGRAEQDEHAQAIHSSEIEVALAMGARSEAEMLEAMRRDLTEIRGANLVIGQPISHRIDHMISGTRASIAVKLFGPDLRTLESLAEEIRGQMEAVPGVVDLSVEEQAQLPFARVAFDREALALHGLRVGDVAETIETAFYGRTVSRVLQGPYAFDLVVRYDDASRADLDAIRQTRIETPSGAWIPLEALAAIDRDVGPNQISRENGQRKRVVMCNVGGDADLVSVVNAITARVAANVSLPQGYYVEYGGQFEAAVDASRRLSWLSLLVLCGIVLLLVVALSSLRDALLVLVNLPLALLGGVVGVFVGGGVVSIASLIGFITLFGIATRNGIMMVTHMRHLHAEEGVADHRAAVVQGASERLVPILMTALASGLGLVPLALAGGQPGSEIQAPMATVILFGLVSATGLNMFVVPSVMLRFGSLRGIVPTPVASSGGAVQHAAEIPSDPSALP